MDHDFSLVEQFVSGVRCLQCLQDFYVGSDTYEVWIDTIFENEFIQYRMSGNSGKLKQHIFRTESNVFHASSIFSTQQYLHGGAGFFSLLYLENSQAIDVVDIKDGTLDQSLKF
eukprot:scaffold14974_cov195-Amphora_coffeaeformis.AAC.51